MKFRSLVNTFMPKPACSFYSIHHAKSKWKMEMKHEVNADAAVAGAAAFDATFVFVKVLFGGRRNSKTHLKTSGNLNRKLRKKRLSTNIAES